MAEVHLQQLLGRPVFDRRGGRTVGRIEEVRAERQDGEWIVREYVLGVGGLVERLAAGGLVASLLGRWALTPQQRTIPWDALDLTDPNRPRLTRTLAELGRRAA